MTDGPVLAPLFERAARDPATLLIMLGAGHVVSRCVHAAVEFNLGDALGAGPLTAVELSERIGLDVSILIRLGTILRGVGLLNESSEEVFSLGPMGSVLQSDGPYAARSLLRLYGGAQFDAYTCFIGGLKNKLPAWDMRFGEPAFSWLARNPEQSELFSEAMRFAGRPQVAELLRLYDFSGYTSIVDVGGGAGDLARALLDVTKNLVVTLADLSGALEAAQEGGDEQGRLRFHAVDFFSDQLPVGEAYVLKHVLHDWSDNDAVVLLKNVKRAGPLSAKMLVCERLLPDDGAPCIEHILDVHMLAMSGGQERTAAHYGELLRRSGWRTNRVFPSPWISVIEAVVED